MLGVIMEYRDLLLQLFHNYCKRTWRTDGSTLASTEVHTSRSLRLAHGGALKPLSKKQLMTEHQFWQLCVDCGLVTRTFNRRAVQTVWEDALSSVETVRWRLPPLGCAAYSDHPLTACCMAHIRASRACA